MMKMLVKQLTLATLLGLMTTTAFTYEPEICSSLPKESFAKFDDYRMFDNGCDTRVKVEKNNKWGLVETAGGVVQPLTAIKYDSIGQLSGYFIVTIDDKKGLLDDTGKEILPVEYDSIYRFSKAGFAKVQKNGKWGFVNGKGELVIPLQYDDAISFPFYEHLAAVKKNNKWGFIDEAGKTIIDFQFDDALPFSEELAAVKKGNKWGYIDKTGKTVLPFQYENARNFGSDDIAPVQKKKGFFKKVAKWGFVDKTGKTVIPFEYDEAEFYELLPRARKGETWTHFDRDGKVVEKPDFCCYGPIQGSRPDRD